MDIGNQLNSDDTETLLIHLLGCRSPLDLQFGGQHIRYLPSEEDELAFERLHTTYFHKILCNSSRFSESQWSGVKNHFGSIFAKIPKTKGDLCESAKNALQDQAIPHQYLGLAIVVFVGEELTDGHLKAGCSFFEGSSRSSRLVRNLVHRIKHIEERNFTRQNVSSLPGLSRAFPFLNLILLPQYCDTSNALSLLTAYFRCTRPIVVVTLGS